MEGATASFGINPTSKNPIGKRPGLRMTPPPPEKEPGFGDDDDRTDEELEQADAGDATALELLENAKPCEG